MAFVSPLLSSPCLALIPFIVLALNGEAENQRLATQTRLLGGKGSQPECSGPQRICVE